MNPTKETLSAFLDGELNPVETARIAELVDHDPALKAFVASQERLRARLRTDLGQVIHEAIPERLLRALERRASIWERLSAFLFAGKRPADVMARAAVPAFALILGIVIGAEVIQVPSRSANLSYAANGELVARGELGFALETKLATDTNGPARIGLTFRDKRGATCRSFALADASSSMDGYACKRGGEWQVGAVVNERGAQAGHDYSLAAAPMPDAIRDAITAEITGVPFDAAQERQARGRDWN